MFGLPVSASGLGKAERIIKAFAKTCDADVLFKRDETGRMWIDFDAAKPQLSMRVFGYSADVVYGRLLQMLLRKLGCRLDTLLVKIDLAGGPNPNSGEAQLGLV